MQLGKSFDGGGKEFTKVIFMWAEKMGHRGGIQMVEIN